MSEVHIFWDNSNIFIAAQAVAERRDGLMQRSAVRLQFSHLFRLAAMGRQVGSVHVVGSIPPDLKVWARLESVTGCPIELYERGAQSGSEQAVDAALQVSMLRVAFDEPSPGTAVLLTGDGAGYEDGVGFHADLRRMHSRGWGIEVLSWDHACNARLKAWAKEVGAYIPLDAHFRRISFIEGGRRVEPPNFTNRAIAHPGGKVTL